MSRQADVRWLKPSIPVVLFLSLAGSACTASDPGLLSYDDWGENCTENTAPAIANVELNSRNSNEIEGIEDVGWLLSLHFDWQDPTPPDSPDPQNLVGGMISAQMLNRSFNSIWIDSDTLKNGCSNGSSSVCSAMGYGSGQIGCAGATAADCTTGQITIVLSGDPPAQEFEDILFELRVRDACGASSSEKNNYATGPYEVGSGTVEIPDDSEEEDGASDEENSEEDT